MYGELLGTHPDCFISWENIVVEKFFYYNGIIFSWTLGFTIIIITNVVRVQSHNKETVDYLKDQVKGLLVTSLLLAILWLPLGWLSYIKDPERNLPSMMPLFQTVNAFFGVILFLCLGLWSKRFRIALTGQMEEKKKMMEEKKKKLEEQRKKKLADASPEEPTETSESPTSEESQGMVTRSMSRPATAEAATTSRPASSTSVASKKSLNAAESSPEDGTG